MFVDYPTSPDITIGYISLPITTDINGNPLVRLFTQDEIYLARKWLFRQ